MTGASRPSAPRAPSEADRIAAERTRVVTRRAIRRLDILEWVILFVGVLLATAGGGGVAWLLAGDLGWSVRATWIAASVLLFVVPGAVALAKIRMEEQADRRPTPERDGDGRSETEGGMSQSRHGADRDDG